MPTQYSYSGSGTSSRGIDVLRNILQSYFQPELAGQQAARNPIQSAFLSQVTTPGAEYGAAKEAATSMASDLFAPGGQIASLVSGARGKAMGQGFSAASAGGAVNGVLRAGVQQVGNTFGQNAASLEANRMNLLGGAYSDSNKTINDLLQSLFAGEATAQQSSIAGNAAKKGLFGLW